MNTSNFEGYTPKPSLSARISDRVAKLEKELDEIEEEANELERQLEDMKGGYTGWALLAAFVAGVCGVVFALVYLPINWSYHSGSSNSRDYECQQMNYRKADKA